MNWRTRLAALVCLLAACKPEPAGPFLSVSKGPCSAAAPASAAVVLLAGIAASDVQRLGVILTELGDRLDAAALDVDFDDSSPQAPLRAWVQAHQPALAAAADLARGQWSAADGTLCARVVRAPPSLGALTSLWPRRGDAEADSRAAFLAWRVTRAVVVHGVVDDSTLAKWQADTSDADLPVSLVLRGRPKPPELRKAAARVWRRVTREPALAAAQWLLHGLATMPETTPVPAIAADEILLVPQLGVDMPRMARQADRWLDAAPGACWWTSEVAAGPGPWRHRCAR